MIAERQIEPTYDTQVIVERVEKLAREIERGLTAEDPLLVGILDGAAFFLCDLLRRLEPALRFDFLRVDYVSDPDATGPLKIQYHLPTPVQDETLVLFKDVVTSGVTESYLQDELRRQGARRVLVACLVEMASQRKTSFEPDFTLFRYEGADLLVGYGLTHDHRYGHLPYIGRWPREEA